MITDSVAIVVTINLIHPSSIILVINKGGHKAIAAIMKEGIYATLNIFFRLKGTYRFSKNHPIQHKQAFRIEDKHNLLGAIKP